MHFKPNASTYLDIWRESGVDQQFPVDLFYWRQGGLVGAARKNAYYVLGWPGTTMTANDITAGHHARGCRNRHNHPAEFTICTFEQKMRPRKHRYRSNPPPPPNALTAPPHSWNWAFMKSKKVHSSQHCWCIISFYILDSKARSPGGPNQDLAPQAREAPYRYVPCWTGPATRRLCGTSASRCMFSQLGWHCLLPTPVALLRPGQPQCGRRRLDGARHLASHGDYRCVVFKEIPESSGDR